MVEVFMLIAGGLETNGLPGPFQPKPPWDSMKMGEITVSSGLDSVLICSLLQLTVSGQVLNLNKFSPLISPESVLGLFAFHKEAQLMS